VIKIANLNSINFDEEVSGYVSKILLYLEAVKIKKESEEPFLYTGGNRGPIYIDNRVLISHLTYRKIIAGFISNVILYKIIDDFDIIAGGATAGMPFAQDVADLLAKPYFYVREKKKEHGTKSDVVGDLRIIEKDINDFDKFQCKAILVEDLVTDGKSKEHFIEQLNNQKVSVEYCIVVFDREQGGKEKLHSLGVSLVSLTNMTKTLDIALKSSTISEKTFDYIQNYLKDPKKWSEERGYEYK
jgi:orotate phosphoribosyltransferase